MQERERKRKVNAKSYTGRKLCSLSVVIILFLTSFTAFVIIMPFTVKAETAPPVTINLLPNAEGSTQQWIVSLGGDSNHYTKVDDPVGSPDDDTTYVYTSALNAIEEFNHQENAVLVGVAITNVRVYARMKYTGAVSSAKVNIGLNVSGTRRSAAADSTLTSAYVAYPNDWANNPADSQAWEKSDIDSLQTSLKLITLSGISGCTVRCTQIYIAVTYVPNTAPTIGEPSYGGWDLGTPKGPIDNCYAQRRWYFINVTYTDVDGATNFDYVELQFWGGSPGETKQAAFRWTEATGTVSVQTGSTKWDVDGVGAGPTWKNGNNVNAVWKFKPQWDAIEVSDYDVQLYCIDDATSSVTDSTDVNQFDVVTTLLTKSIECADPNDPDRVNVGETVEVIFDIRYADEPGSSTAVETLYPPDDEFGTVSILNSAKEKMGDADPIQDGLEDGRGRAVIPMPGSVGIDTYHLYVDMKDTDYTDKEFTMTETIITDQIDMLSKETNNHNSRINIGGTVTYTVTAKLEYDNHALGSGDTLTTSECGVITESHGKLYVDVCLSSLGRREYSMSSVGSEATYGITTIYDPVENPPPTIWDKINVGWSAKTSPNASENVIITISPLYMYNSEPCASYQYNVRRSFNSQDKGLYQTGLTGNTFSYTPPLAGIYNFTIQSFTDKTYGIANQSSTLTITAKQKITLVNNNKNNGVNYVTWGANASVKASMLKNNFNLIAGDTISRFSNSSSDSWSTNIYNVESGAGDFTINRWDSILITLTSAASKSYSFTPDGISQTQKIIDMKFNSTNKGYLYITWSNDFTITAQNFVAKLNGGNPVSDNVDINVYNSTTNTWKNYNPSVPAVFQENFNINTYDVICIRAPNHEYTYNTNTYSQ
ncbi:MAG: hypothetical protein NTV74_07550 [Euryarchaeota archaeon]|nr:hypothetical protein [Euryarchaeota archaeon]